MKFLIVTIWILVIVNLSDTGSSSEKELNNTDTTVKIYYVVQENVNTKIACPNVECHTLIHYMNYSLGPLPQYFKSNEVYSFWSGKHKPLDNATVIISNVTSLKLIGNEAKINCNGMSAGFLFDHSTDITLQNLEFTSCTGYHFHYASAPLIFISGCGLTLHGINISESRYGAFFIKDTLGTVELKELKVVNNNRANHRLPQAVSTSTVFYKQCFGQRPFLRIKDSKFINNSNLKWGAFPEKNHSMPSAGGITIRLECPRVDVEINGVMMGNNSGGNGGNLAILSSRSTCANVTIVGSCFESGYSLEGSGVYADFKHTTNLTTEQAAVCGDCQGLLHIINSRFVDNKVQFVGGGVYIKYRQFGTICGTKGVKLTKCIFEKNSVIKSGFGGIALHSINLLMTNYVIHSIPQFSIEINKSTFKNNHMTMIPGPTDIQNEGAGVIFTKSNSYFRLSNTTISDNTCSGILAVSSNLILSGKIIITNNMALSGGGLLLCESAIVYFEEYTDVVIAYNRAKNTGGGVTVERKCLHSKPMCFYQLGQNVLTEPSLIGTIKVHMFDNLANFSGDNLFGGSVEYCYMISGHSAILYHDSMGVFWKIFNISNDTPSSIASPPQRVCLCQNSSYNCDIPASNLEKFPGELFTIKAVLVGQFNGLVQGAVCAQLTNPKNKSLKNFVHKIQRIDQRKCKNLEFTIYNNQSNLVLHLGAQRSGDVSGCEQLQMYKLLNINIKIKRCPLGFVLRNGTDYQQELHCDCIDLFTIVHRSGTIVCNITEQRIKKTNTNIWIGLTETNSVALHPNCPLDYCNSNQYIAATNISLDQDSQCVRNRKGILCGACSKGYSLVLDATKCRQCSNYWLFLYIFFAFVGITLIFLLTVFNWTIADGTFGGIVFYCNIIKSNMTSYFPRVNIYFLTPALKTFVALFNLEGNMPVCLYNGMDAYWYTWLHFLLPLFILTVAGAFVCLASRCSCIVRNNAVRVLASLILLSYTKLLYITIDAVHFTYLYTDKGTMEARWFLDGNVKYFTGKHIPLVLATSLFSLILLPFTFCLLCIQCLQKVSSPYRLKWVYRLKPFFDAYTGPFTAKARFWTGLLLLVRAIIFILSSFNTEDDRKLNIGCIALAVLLLLSIALMLPQGLYRNHRLNILECWLLLNLGILSITTSYAMMIHHKHKARVVRVGVTHLSVGTVFHYIHWNSCLSHM